MRYRKPFDKLIRVRLTERTLDDLERLADDAGTTRSDMVRRLIVDNSRREERQAQTPSTSEAR